MKTTVIAVLTVLALVCLALAQQPTAKTVPASASADSGKETYGASCASCHGADARGNGPVTPALKRVPPDLTKLARSNGGKFPSTKVYRLIQGDPDLPAHGSKSMPVWGPIFLEKDKLDHARMQQRIQGLVDYIATLQAK